jgi:competence protein ComEC
MTLEIIAFALGIAVLQWQAGLPSLVCLGSVALAGAALLLAIRGAKLRVAQASSDSSSSASNNPSSSTAGRGSRVVRCGCRWLGWGLVGFAWAGLLAQQRLADELAPEVEGQDVEVVGIVSAMPQRFENGWRFVFQVESSALPVPKQLSLAWYQSRWLEEGGQRLLLADVHAGDRWRLTVRLKRPHGNANPHGFDYEGWLLEQGIRATGYVRSSAGFTRLDSFVAMPGTLVERGRETLRTRFATTLGDRPALGILVALAVGDQRGIANGE